MDSRLRENEGGITDERGDDGCIWDCQLIALEADSFLYCTERKTMGLIKRTFRKMELAAGVEPVTCALQVRCSTN